MSSGGCSSRSPAGGGGGGVGVLSVSCPVLSMVVVLLSALVVLALVVSLGVISSGSPETGQRSPKQGRTDPKNPYIYRYIPRASQECPGVPREPAKTPPRQKSKFRHGQPVTGSLQGSGNSKF